MAHVNSIDKVVSRNENVKDDQEFVFNCNKLVNNSSFIHESFSVLMHKRLSGLGSSSIRWEHPLSHADGPVDEHGRIRLANDAAKNEPRKYWNKDALNSTASLPIAAGGALYPDLLTPSPNAAAATRAKVVAVAAPVDGKNMGGGVRLSGVSSDDSNVYGL